MATAKLTLSVDRDTIQIAKEVASESNMSVSKLFKKLIIESYKKRKKKTEVKIKPLNELPEWIQQLVIAKEPVPDFDHKAEYHKHLDEKYGL
jgi:FMN-dependent NADH-azoreductase